MQASPSKKMKFGATPTTPPSSPTTSTSSSKCSSDPNYVFPLKYKEAPTDMGKGLFI